MIGRLRGVIVEQAADGSCILEAGGVGYEVFVPLGTLGRLPPSTETVTLHIHTVVREDALQLYGFARGEDKRAFRVLLGVSSIGPKLAMAILGGLSAPELASAVARQDKKSFKGISGVGKRTVERLLLELKDKLGFVQGVQASIVGLETARESRPPKAPPTTAVGQVTAMLEAMGFKSAQAERAVSALGDDLETDDVQALLRLALAQLS